MLSQLSQPSVERLCGAQVIVDLRCCVRELVENALDAGASEISVRLRNISRDPSVEVADNGGGIAKENYAKVCLPHSTSKISDFDDLYSGELQTFGFRGEALASLCAISGLVQVTTRTSDAELAQVLRYGSGGTLVDGGGRTARPVGTTVEVQGFLSRLPVRHTEFLTTAKRHVTNTVSLLQQYAVARPDVRMEIHQDAKILFSSIGNFTDALAAAEAVMGVVRSHFSDLEISGSLWRMRGWVTSRSASSGSTRSSASSMQFFFLNGKPADPARRLVKHVNALYRKLGNSVDHPRFLLFLTVDRKSVDVNVTPDKRTIFLPHELETEIIDALDAKLKLLLATPVLPVRAALQPPSPVSSASPPASPVVQPANVASPPRKRRQVERPNSAPASAAAPEAAVEFAVCCATQVVRKIAEPETRRLLPPKVVDARQVWVKKEEFGSMEVVGQFNRGFIVARTQSDLFLVDQHAADEKNRFEALNASSTIEQQPLVVPKKLRLAPAQEQLVREHGETWRANGFGVRVNEDAPPGQKVEITAFPSMKGLGVERSATFTVDDFMEIMELLEESGAGAAEDGPTRRGDLWGVDSEFPRPLKTWYHLASRACRTAIMIGDSLTVTEMRKILQNLTTLKQPWNCPHGRPTFKHVAQLEDTRRNPMLTRESYARVFHNT